MCKSSTHTANANVQHNQDKISPDAHVEESINFYELHAPTTHGIAITIVGFIAVVIVFYFLYSYYAGTGQTGRGGCLKRRHRSRSAGVNGPSRAYDVRDLEMAVREVQRRGSSMPIQAARRHFSGPEMQMPGLTSGTDSSIGGREKF